MISSKNLTMVCAGFALFVGYKIAYASDVLLTCIQIGVLLSLLEIRLDHTGMERKQAVLQACRNCIFHVVKRIATGLGKEPAAMCCEK